MSEPFVAEVRIFGFNNVIPKNWAICDGSSVKIAQNTALFALIGISYGGDGKTYYNLPNVQGRVVVGAGQGPGLQNYTVGLTGGSTQVTLTSETLPTHNHSLFCLAPPGDTNLPSGSTVARTIGDNPYSAPGSTPPLQMDPSAIANTGGNAAHNNMQPYVVLNYCIALSGIFPPRP